jgi:alkaline phosphatase D
VPIIGVWDDHDFGLNDGGSDFPRKEAYRKMFLDFMDTPLDSPLRSEKSKGIYQDFVIILGDIKVHIVLLDVRFNFDRKTNTRLDSD